MTSLTNVPAFRIDAQGAESNLTRVQTKPVYVETHIRAPLEAVWRATQEPERHREWDLRFTDIDYLPKTAPDAPQQFRYATRIGFGLRIEGRGESVAQREGTGGERTSVLKFWSDDPKSLIRSGGGYWRYLPTPDGVRFLTLYSYRTRFGAAGAWLDRVGFRPLLGCATAWSFDALRLALETGVPVRQLWNQLAAAVAARVTLALVWIYHGLVPKLLFPHTGEQDLLRAWGAWEGQEARIVRAVGVGEIIFGFVLLVSLRRRGPLVLSALLLVALLLGAVFTQPSTLVAPFGPASLTLALLGLTTVELLLRRQPLPSPGRCRRTPPADHVPLP